VTWEALGLGTVSVLMRAERVRAEASAGAADLTSDLDVPAVVASLTSPPCLNAEVERALASS
jgi:hypothetical protein